MAYTPQPNDILEVRFVTFDPTPPTQVGINVMHWLVSTLTGVGVTQGDIAADLDAAAAPLYKLLLANPTSYRGVMVQKIWPAPRQLAEVSIGNAGVGTAGALQAPTQVAGVLKFTTAKAGRAFRGRIFVPFLSTSSLTAGGNQAAGYFTDLNNLGTMLTTPRLVTVGGNATPISPVVWHAKNFGKPPAGIHTYDPILLATPSTLLGTQRRRGNYGRVNASSPI
jgi:hypothetical protein